MLTSLLNRCVKRAAVSILHCSKSSIAPELLHALKFFLFPVHLVFIQVVLSGAICTKNGKALLSRQFVEMSRIRIEGLLAAFPKLLGSGEEKQHTFIETDTVRYVYQPIDNLFLLLITNKASNIVEDLETLRLLSKIVPDVAGGVTEERVSDKCFELVFAFDEVLTTGGYRESVTLQQIKTNMEMDSHEEKLALMIKQSKMDSAKDQAARQAKAIKERQRELARDRLGATRSGLGGAYQGIGGGGMDYVGGSGAFDGQAGIGQDAFGASTPSVYAPSTVDSFTVSKTETVKTVSKGMKLGAPSKAASMLDSLVQEDNLSNIAATRAPPLSAGAGSGEEALSAPVIQHQPIQLAVEEKIVAHLTRDGAVDAFEVKGSLTLTATTEAAALSKVALAAGGARPVPAGLNFQTHPKVNKQEYDSNRVLVLKDTSKGFPVGRAVGVLRWSYSSTDDSVVPITLNCWPEEEGQGKMNISIEYQMNGQSQELHNVNVSIPLGTAEPPEVASIDGTYRHDPREQRLIWHMDLVDASNSSGALEFVVAGRDAQVFFPIIVSFSSQILYADVNVTAVNGLEDGSAPIPYSLTKLLSPDSYIVG